MVTIDDPDAEIIADAGSFSAFGIRKKRDFTSIWSLLPLDRNMIASIYDYAKIHRYLRGTEDVFNANANYIMLQAAKDGEKEILLRSPSDVTELFSGRKIGSNLSKITDKMTFGETRLYQVIPSRK